MNSLLTIIGSKKKVIVIEEDFKNYETESEDDRIITYDESSKNNERDEKVVVDIDLHGTFKF